jgi:phospholipid/cholesterol/gamma-HCH transport system ATP-binding protein
MNDEKRQPLAEVIRINNLSISFGDNHVLREFSMSLYEGENVVVLGKSGSGKSVLIKCIMGLLQADAGSIEVMGQEVTKLTDRELDQLRSQIGFLFQSNALYDSMTVRQNLEFPLRRHRRKLSAEERNRLVMDALTDVGLPHTVDSMPDELSGGMKKRIALARALMLKPRIILYDEPTTGLDPVTAREISALIVRIQQLYHTSAIIISHDMNCVRSTANRVVMLVDGKSHCDGSPVELSHSTDTQVKAFFDIIP